MLTRCMEKGRVSAALAMWHFLCLCHSATARAYIVHVAASVCACVCTHAQECLYVWNIVMLTRCMEKGRVVLLRLCGIFCVCVNLQQHVVKLFM